MNNDLKKSNVTALRLGETILVPRVQIADTFFPRFLGLMGRRGLPADEALLFPRCNSIHTCFMRFPIDVVFVDDSGCVVDLVENLKAWRLLFPRKRAVYTLELAGHRAKELGIERGSKLSW